MNDSEVLTLLKNRFGTAKRGNKNWIRIKCPTCTPADAKKLKRGVNLKTLKTKCFICELPLSLEQLFGDVKVEPSFLPEIEETEHPQARELPYTEAIPLNSLSSDHPAIKFLLKDHLLNIEVYSNKYNASYVTEKTAKDIIFEKEDKPVTRLSTADSIVFPVYFNKELVGWQCRFIPGTPGGDRMRKIRYLHIFPKGKYLYNYDNAREFKTVIVVEGIKKSWKFPNAVATLGKGLSEKQIELIQKWDNIIFMMDGDDVTQKKFIELADLIGRNKNVININPAKYGFPSPDEMTENEAQIIAYDEWTKKYGN
jgi:hypothetical protein